MIDLRLGDFLEVDFLRELVDLVITSPPYYNAREYSQWSTFGEYLSFIEKVFVKLKSILKEGGIICWNVSPHIVSDNRKYSLGFEHQCLLEKYFQMQEILIWEKPKGNYRLSFAETKWESMSREGERPVRLMPRYEYIFVYSKGQPIRHKVDEQVGKDFWHWGNVVELPTASLKGHHGVFSIDLPLQMMDWYGKKPMLVFDPFFGSGTTARACRIFGCDFSGTEINSVFYNYAKEWVSQDVLNRDYGKRPDLAQKNGGQLTAF